MQPVDTAVVLPEPGALKDQGRGTEVLDRTAIQHLNQVTSFTETMREKGYDVSLKSIYIDTCIPAAEILSALELPEHTAVVRIQRIHLADGVPIAMMTNYLPQDLVPGILEDADQITSLYAYLEQHHHLQITDSTDIIRAKAADFTEARLLDLPVGHPLIVNHRVTRMHDRPIEVVHMLVDADRYEFAVHLSGRPGT